MSSDGHALPPGPYYRVGGEVDRVEVTLRIAGDDLDPSRITALFARESTFSAVKGEPRTSAGRKVVQPTGTWQLSLAESSEWQLNDTIAALLAQLPSDPALWQHLANNYQMDVFCALYLESWNRGVQLSPSTLKELAARHLTLGLDIYSHVEGQE